MNTITFDLETFWSTEFSLSKINFMEYIKSPEAEVISVSVKVNNEPTVVKFGADVGPYLKSLDWANSMAIAHNGNEFDFPLLVWQYDVHPKLFVDTLAMSKAKHQSEVGGSLKKLSEHYGLPEKDNTVLMNTKGRRLKDFSPAEIADMAKYNVGDTENTYKLFKLLAKDTPPKEFMLMDMTARMICYPQFVADTELLYRTLKAVEVAKEATLLEVADLLGVLTAEEAREQLASAKKFAEVLTALGVEVPTKISKTTGKEAPALAKTDEAFTALLEHPDEKVQAVVAARLDVKSTLLETRLTTMKNCADHMGGWMPVPLAYHAATTGRWGGRVWNPQNLPRIPRDKQGEIIPKMTNALRKSLCAPDGYRVVVSDLSGIELRVNHYLWGVKSTQDLYDGDPEADLYKEFAAALFGVPKAEVTKDQRQLAKVAQLGLGFGAGATTFKKVAKLMGGIELDDAEALRVTTAWRTKYIDIVNGWRKCQQAVQSMYIGASYRPDPRGLIETSKNKVRLPSGRYLHYPNLHTSTDDKGKLQYKYGVGRNVSKVYSGLMDENLVQAIARDVIAEACIRLRSKYGYLPALLVHDEYVTIAKEDRAEEMLRRIDEELRTPPEWLPGIILWSEGSTGVSYGDCK